MSVIRRAPWGHARQPPSRHRGTVLRRAALGHHRAAVQGRPGLAAAGLAHLRALRRGRRHPAGGRLPRYRPAARGGQPGRAGRRRTRIRRVSDPAERRRRAHQRQPRGPADWRHPGPGRDHRGALASQRGAPAGLGRLRGVTRGRRHCRGRPVRRREPGRRWPRAGIPAAVGGLHGGPDAAAERTRSGRRDRRAVPGSRAGQPGPRRRHGGRACRASRVRRRPGHCRARGRRHAGALHPLRLRPEPRVR